MKRIILVVTLVSLLVLCFSLTLSADTTQILQGSEMYAPLVFECEAKVPVRGIDGPLPDTSISTFQTPSVRSSVAGGTRYWSDFFFLDSEEPDDHARLTYYIQDEWVWDYDPYTFVISLDPVYLDISGLIDEGFEDIEKLLPVFYLSTFGVNSKITVEANITSVDPSGTARDNVSIANVYLGKTTVEQRAISFYHYLPEFKYGDKIFVNEFTITCENFSPAHNDSYVTGFVSEVHAEPIDAQNSPTRVEMSSVPLVSILWNSIVDVFEIDLIPGLSLGTILLAIVGLPLLVWFLKLVAGG